MDSLVQKATAQKAIARKVAGLGEATQKWILSVAAVVVVMFSGFLASELISVKLEVAEIKGNRWTDEDHAKHLSLDHGKIVDKYDGVKDELAKMREAIAKLTGEIKALRQNK